MPSRASLSRIGRAAALSLALSVVGAPGLARAGELKFAGRPMEIDADGKLTKDARSGAKGEVESESPDEESWVVHVWAQIDKGAEGPLYLEFTREHAGARLMAYSHEHADYGGEKFVSLTIELSRSMGFRFDDQLDVEALQIEENDKRRVLARGKLTLRKSTKASSPAPVGGGSRGSSKGDDEKEAEDEASEQDIADSFAGGGAQEEDGEPPSVESGDKKGCSVEPRADLPWALALLFALGLCGRRGRV
jgi:hypothetical protein